MFDQPDGDTTYHLFVYLTDSESREVFDAPYDAGMLEAVRHNLRNPGALLAVAREGVVATRRFEIPNRGVEPEFVADLILAAENAPEYAEAVRLSVLAELARVKERQEEAGRSRLVHGLNPYAAALSRLKSSAQRAEDRTDELAAERALKYTFA
ncbi:hypothetical protein [Nocardia callitridis]|uniref:hypothetical protein n=1 Tax=Nocardia callitridis TaxID=648753 RepID=UPI0031E980D9